jgi:hypothetical protein
MTAFRDAAQLQSAVALAITLLLLGLSLVRSSRTRMWGSFGAIVLLTGAALATPLRQPIRMGDSGTYTSSRRNFDFYTGAAGVRIEAHLSSMVLRALDRLHGASGTSPAQAFATLSKIATVWFAVMLILAGWSGGWSPSTVRYVGLACAAPSTLMYFGYRELGYLSLNPAAFPLLVKGFRGWRGQFDAGCALFGLGAALHGFGLLSLVGVACMSLAARLRLATRIDLLQRAFAFGTAAYLIWMFIWVVIVHVPILPGHASYLPWRPFSVDGRAEGRVIAALTSPHGAAEAVATAWIVGVPLALTLLLVAGTARARSALTVAAFALPSLVFVIGVWPVQGLAVEADYVFGAFPALYALAWFAAQSTRTTIVAAIVLASGHVVFWRVMLGDTFVTPRV